MQRTPVETHATLEGLAVRFLGHRFAVWEPLARAWISSLQIGTIALGAYTLGMPSVLVGLCVASAALLSLGQIVIESVNGTWCWTTLSITQHRVQISGERATRRILEIDRLVRIEVSDTHLCLHTPQETIDVPIEGNTRTSVDGAAAVLRRLIALQRVDGASPSWEAHLAELQGLTGQIPDRPQGAVRSVSRRASCVEAYAADRVEHR